MLNYLRPIAAAAALIVSAYVLAGTWKIYPWLIIDRDEYHLAMDYEKALEIQEMVMAMQSNRIKQLEQRLLKNASGCFEI